jgi:hypothetical protein
VSASSIVYIVTGILAVALILGTVRFKVLTSVIRFGAISLSPFLIGIALLLAGQPDESRRSEYWAVAPWLLFWAVPGLIVSLPIAIAVEYLLAASKHTAREDSAADETKN